MTRDITKAVALRHTAVEKLRRIADDYADVITIFCGIGDALDLERVKVAEWRERRTEHHWQRLVDLLTDMRRDFIGTTEEERLEAIRADN